MELSELTFGAMCKMIYSVGIKKEYSPDWLSTIKLLERYSSV